VNAKSQPLITFACLPKGKKKKKGTNNEKEALDQEIRGTGRGVGTSEGSEGGRRSHNGAGERA